MGEIEKIKEILLQNIDCEAIVLFGSFARNTQNEESDIDIAFKSKQKITKKEIFDIKQKLEELINRDIDLINLDEIGEDFRYEILMNGITLCCKDEVKFELYKLDMYAEYFDFNISRQPIIDKIKNGGTLYGK